jgi:hypothetical protein
MRVHPGLAMNASPAHHILKKEKKKNELKIIGNRDKDRNNDRDRDKRKKGKW